MAIGRKGQNARLTSRLIGWRLDIEEFKVERARESLRQVGFRGDIIELTRRGGPGFDAWLGWLRSEIAALRAAAA